MRRFASPFRFASLLAAVSQNPAWGAALALVAIQVGIGLIMKGSQKNGKYAFSPSSSVTISEFLKLLLSTAFFWRECKERAARLEPPHFSTGASRISDSEGETESSESKPFLEDPESNGGSRTKTSAENFVDNVISTHLQLRTFWQYVKNEVSLDVRYGFVQLALFYVLINNLIFVSYKLADPGTISLTKSGVTLITAVVMIVTLGTKIGKIQWIAISIQICGLAVTQYHPETGSAYPFTTYLVLMFQVFLSAASGVYNQALLKSGNASLHAANMTLYAAGAVINLMLHIVLRILKRDEPGFFTGYGSWGAILVILSNVFIGLAITAVYKYADAVIKCFATAISTGILLCLSPILFATELSFLTLPGTIMVFIASWLYMEAAPPKDPTPALQQVPEDDLSAPSKFRRYMILMKIYRKSVLATFTVLTIIICAFMTMSNSLIPDMAKHISTSKPRPSAALSDTLDSPFRNTLAFIRWNSEHGERMPLLEKYAPFFHDLHFSMPNYLKDTDLPKGFHNLTHDAADDSPHIYIDLAKTMQFLLDALPGTPEAEIDGLLYFHFDAWIAPLDYANTDFEQIWYPDIPDTGADDGGPGGPKFECMEKVEKYPWWGFVETDFHEKAMAAARLVEQHEGKFKVNTKEWCVGWSDIYYVPKKYFPDYVFLANIFGALQVFHEVAVPTIIHIIDQSRRVHPSRSILNRFGECWGSCCTSNPDIHDVLNNRCGHRLDYRAEDVTRAHYDRLVNEAGMLGQKLSEPYFPFS